MRLPHVALFVIVSLPLSGDLPPPVCRVGDAPIGAACAETEDCKPMADPCMFAVCDPSAITDEMICQERRRGAGSPCSSGVGSCSLAGVCAIALYACKPGEVPDAPLHRCCGDSECGDGNECTIDICLAGWCTWAPLDAPCGDKGIGRWCLMGACCEL